MEKKHGRETQAISFPFALRFALSCYHSAKRRRRRRGSLSWDITQPVPTLSITMSDVAILVVGLAIVSLLFLYFCARWALLHGCGGRRLGRSVKTADQGMRTPPAGFFFTDDDENISPWCFPNSRYVSTRRSTASVGQGLSRHDQPQVRFRPPFNSPTLEL
jgi:hypothetical protein